MQFGAKTDILLTVQGGFLVCPFCGNKKAQRIDLKTEARSLPVYCRKCGHEILIDIHRGQCSRSQSPSEP